MLTTIIRAVIQRQQSVLLFLFLATVYSLYSIRSIPLDAIPDISDSQIIIYAKWARSPQQLENKITQPIIHALLGGEGIQSIRASSHLGYSFIYIIFQNRNQREQIRQLVLERLNTIRPRLPTDADISLGPNASSMGWIFQYALVDHTQTRDLRELRLLNENTIIPALKTVTGIAEIASVGGLEKQIELKIFPPLLAKTGISLRQILNRLKTAFQQVGGRTIELTNRDYHLRGVINTDELDKLEYLIIARAENGQPVLLRDIGYFQVNYDLRRGIADLNGEGEVVGGIVIMEQQQNVVTVTQNFKNALQQLSNNLPQGIEIISTYDRSSLIMETLKNFSTALLYELLIVMLIIFWALRNGRASVAPVFIILLSCLYTLIFLSFFDQTINLLSLAGLAIAIGEMADASIVIIENCTTELAKQKNPDYRTRVETIIRASARMMRPLLFSLLIILSSFLPVFFLNEREGLLFNPLAFSKTFAMGFSTLLTLFLLPIIIIWVFKPESSVKAAATKQDSPPVLLYTKLLTTCIHYRYIFISLSLLMLFSAGLLMNSFQKDYMPEMEEGSILYMPTTLPGLPMREAGWILQQIDKKIKAFPEVKRVFGKLGRADTSTDPAPVTMIESTILLNPQSTWRKGMTKKKLIAEMDKALQIPGYINSWTQPIAGRVMMQDTGIQTAAGIKVMGPDIKEIEKISKQVEKYLNNIPGELAGSASIIAERISQGYYIDVENDLQQLAEHNVLVDEAILTARYGIGGENIMSIPQADHSTVPLSMQYSPEYIDTLDKITKAPVITATGQSIPLGKISSVAVKKMPEMIRNDNGQLAAYIYININATHITATDYVLKARKYLSQQLVLPTGYTLQWTGTYQYAEQARDRLLWIVPLTLMIMFCLLVLAFRSTSISFMILLSAPFALIGGVILQWGQGDVITTAVVIGYIAVLAVAIQTAIIMVEFIREALARRPQSQSYMDAVIEGSVARLRPKLMTVATTVLGLIPIIIASGSGMDITRPIAAPSVGGMISSTIYVLFLIPCLFVIGQDLKKRFQR
ncbi:Cobalt-zinc-cadmium resistance protein CzcA; Cation efflux system protein CusA [hydrothermal vent metagenome]|uniref:Cobalt-zinc-cadmium resistance protein CzcA Cation efflux system protein CusA n=1 Tax=hydrothermal vent metagenome TaxID=652676 RepID=A0A3B0YE63_9ZZZZ